MKRLRILAFNASGVLGERTYSRFPVRVGRHPQNEFQIVDPRVSRFHAHFACESDVLVFRDVESQNGTVVLEGDGPGRVIRSTEVRASDGRLTVLVGGVRLQARLEEREAAELPDAFAPAARDAVHALLSVCPLQGDVPATCGDLETIRPVLDALFDSLFMLRLGLHAADEIAPAGQREEEPPRSEALSALIAWTHANTVALRIIEHSLEATRVRDARLLSEGIEAIDTLLRELAPERLESGTKDVGTEWPATRATAVLARYREAHRQLAQRHARRPNALLGKTFAELQVTQQANERNIAASAERSPTRRARLRSEAFRATSADTGEHPPSSD